MNKFTIEYSCHARSDEPSGVHRTNDSVEAEEYLTQLLQAHSRILSIKHEGVELPQVQADRMIKVAGDRLLSEMLGHALDLDNVQVCHRFGLAA